MKIGDIVLQPGDTLLLETQPAFAERHRNSRDFFLVSTVHDSAPARHDKAWIAIAILVAMVAAIATGWLSMLAAAMLAGGLMILTRCLSGPEARGSVDWSVLIVIAAALGISKAVEKTGLAAMLAGGIVDLVGKHPWVALAVISGIVSLFNGIITGKAAAVLMFPVAMATAEDLNVSIMPFALSIMITAAASFSTPLGYQTNLMVYGPGGYRFADYLRVGGPLNVLIWAVVVALAPLIWPF